MLYLFTVSSKPHPDVTASAFIGIFMNWLGSSRDFIKLFDKSNGSLILKTLKILLVDTLSYLNILFIIM